MFNNECNSGCEMIREFVILATKMRKKYMILTTNCRIQEMGIQEML